ncbi:hypothetical protein V2A60_004183 [Cordyceps javanica]
MDKNASQRAGHAPATERKPPPIFSKDTRMPHISEWSQHRIILLHSMVPLAVVQLLQAFGFFSTGARCLHQMAVFFIYYVSYLISMKRQGRALKAVASQTGYLDGDAFARDGLPRGSRFKVLVVIPVVFGMMRIAMLLLLAYDEHEPPLHHVARPGWWVSLYFTVSIYCLVLDWWYYVAHRALHELRPLWRFHRTHHTTKHPNMRLAAYADVEQELFDAVGAPLLAYASTRAAGIPMDLYSWWICLQYVSHTEIMGHSGLRAYLRAPLTLAWLLRIIDAELVVEDHDLHHRHGWRQAHNYGKQSRLWDRIFGTCGRRIETVPENVDWDWKIDLPLC